MYRTVETTIAAGQASTSPTNVPGRLIGIALSLDVGGAVKLYASFNANTLNACQVLDSGMATVPGAGQTYFMLNGNHPVGALSYYVTAPVQTTQQTVQFVYEDSPLL